MSSSILISSIFLFLLFSNIMVNITNAHSLIEKACSNSRLYPTKSRACIHALQSKRKIASAKNFYDLSIAIIETGLSSFKSSRAYIESQLRNRGVGPNLKAALKECNNSYYFGYLSFNSALKEVRDDKEYLTASYDLLVGCTDYIQRCRDNVALGKIKDRTISSTNELASLYGLSALEAVDQIEKGKNV